MMFSPTTLDLFAFLLGQVTLSAASDDFDEMAARISTAKRELIAAIEATPAPSIVAIGTSSGPSDEL